MKRQITIHIAGQRYLVKSDADESYVQGLARRVDERVVALKGQRLVATQADLALAALQLADELEHERQRHKELMQRIAQRSQHMLEYLNQLSPVPAAVEP